MVPTVVHEPKETLQILLMNQRNPLSLPISAILYDPNEAKWRDKANCRNTPVDVFFPDKGATKQKVQIAKAICNECTVEQQCADWSLQFSERALLGIWGGMTGKDRRIARRKLGLSDDDTPMDE